MSGLSCRLCHQSSLITSMTLSQIPGNIQRLFRPEEIHRDSAIELSVLTCSRCGFVQIAPLLENAYYDNYLMGTLHTTQAHEYQQRLARDFVAQHDLVGKRVCEIGCGHGSFLTHLAEAGCQVSGIEPSNSARAMAQSHGFNVDSGYIHADRVLAGGPFDAFVTRQVLEHVSDIHGFLRGVYLNLSPGGVGLIEVPSLEKLLIDRGYYNFFSDHVNYFSMPTLRLALEMNGFDVLAAWRDMFDEYNIVTVIRRELPDLQSVYMNSILLGNDIRNTIDEQQRAGKKIAMWGVGGKGLSIMANAGIHDVDLLVDSDPLKQGLFTPVSRLLVSPPAAIKTVGVDTVIITAMAFRYEIERTLREELNFAGEVLVIGNRLQPSNTWMSSN